MKHLITAEDEKHKHIYISIKHPSAKVNFYLRKNNPILVITFKGIHRIFENVGWLFFNTYIETILDLIDKKENFDIINNEIYHKL